MTQRIAVIGAGPIGLEAALYAAQAGYSVDVYERFQVAANVRDWGHVRLFSPFGMNASPWGREALVASHGARWLPRDEELLTGREFAERYLLPLERLPQLSNRIHEQCEVIAISRSHTWKRDLIGKPERGRDSFRLLLRDGAGERTAEADVVLDCSGTYPHHNWAGVGGIPALGETSALTANDYRLPDILGRDRNAYVGMTTLIIGGGYSAATAVVSIARLAEEVPGTRAIWITRSERRPPLDRVPNDALPERDALAAAVNRLAMSDGGPIEWRPGLLIQSIERESESGKYSVATNGGEQCEVDRVIANVGYRPDRRLYEELQVHECYASGGTMKLAAALLGVTSTDCLAQSTHGAKTLLNPEPNFFVLGAKSYGRDSRFLLKVGIEQVRDVFSLLAGAP